MPPILRLLTTALTILPFTLLRTLFTRLVLRPLGLSTSPYSHLHWSLKRELVHAASRVMASTVIFEAGTLRSHFETGKQRIQLDGKKRPRGVGFDDERVDYAVWEVERMEAELKGDPIVVEAIESRELSGVDKGEKRVVVMWHGGGFAVGDPTAVRHHNLYIALHTPCLCLAPAYRLRPAENYPCALNDCDSVYSYLLAEGYRPENITLAGYSAGSNLALSLSFRLLKQSRPLPRRLVLWTPWMDMTNCAPSTRLNEECMLPSTGFGTVGIERGQQNEYSSFEKTRDPFVSPLFFSTDAYRNLGKLGVEIWMEIGQLDRLRDEGLLLYLKLARATVQVRAAIYEEATHMIPDELGESAGADEAYGDLVRWLDGVVESGGGVDWVTWDGKRTEWTDGEGKGGEEVVQGFLKRALEEYAGTVVGGKAVIKGKWDELGFGQIWEELVPNSFV